MSNEWFCDDCGESCEIYEETFDYAGTHCNHGIGGIHRTGVYVSRCCDAEFDSVQPNQEGVLG